MPLDNDMTAPAFDEEIPLGESAATGRICPRTGWWECVDSGDVLGGRRQLFRRGERLPHAVLLGERSLWERLTGAQPTHRTVTVWTLVDYEPPLPPPPADEDASSQPPTTEQPTDTDADNGAADDDDVDDEAAEPSAPQPPEPQRPNT